MSVLTFTSTTYAGENSGLLISRNLLGANTLDRKLLTIQTGIKKKQVIQRIDDTVVLGDPTVNFTPQAGADPTITERVLEPVEMHAQKEYSFAQLKTAWQAAQLSPGTFQNYVPSNSLSDFLLVYMQSKINIAVDKLIWGGKALAGSLVTFTAAYQGLIPKMEADAAVNKYAATIGQLTISGITIAANAVVTHAAYPTGYSLKTGDWVTIVGANAATLVGGVAISGQSFKITVTSATTFVLNATTTGTATGAAGSVQYINQTNVVEVLTSVYNQIPDEIAEMTDLKWYLPIHVKKALEVALSVGGGIVPFFTGQKSIMDIAGNLEVVNYFPKNTIAVACVSNMFFGTDLLSDQNEVRIKDFSESTMDLKYGYRAAMQSDVNYGFSEEIVLYRPA